MALVCVAVVLLITVFVTQQHASARFFTAECTKNPDNQFLCATNQPDVVVALLEGMDGHHGCAMRCTRDKRCRHFNYFSSPESDQSCQLYYSNKPISFSIVNGCQHYHAQQAGCKLVWHGKFVFVAQVGSPQKVVMELRDASPPNGVGMDVLITGDPSDLQFVRIGG